MLPEHNNNHDKTWNRQTLRPRSNKSKQAEEHSQHCHEEDDEVYLSWRSRGLKLSDEVLDAMYPLKSKSLQQTQPPIVPVDKRHTLCSFPSVSAESDHGDGFHNSFDSDACCLSVSDRDSMSDRNNSDTDIRLIRRTTFLRILVDK